MISALMGEGTCSCLFLPAGKPARPPLKEESEIKKFAGFLKRAAKENARCCDLSF